MSSATTSSIVTRARVFSGYRRLFRARKIVFHGDQRALRESRVAIREQFDLNRTVASNNNDGTIEGLLSMIDEAENMLLNGIVQGKLNDNTGNYEVKVKAEHAERPEEDKATLEPITDETVHKLHGKPQVEVTTSKPEK
mmetsp:Transcript_29349/g.41546  ORF Transcript_29349/g.41546 Transcript_29349/m.41546 type:complete len:139 (-) Transcript_29349:1199-1615(-)|eukprot:CAMPEP_0202451696 /NCGR_PEP_ID=MMETSP1360-20130828/10070_1 /ASSEMBLY_ACC=CAM_ASM_000848 /TAXON_ID=515479 /ORGANISM="Licmophora paradoxa, Strain CCMP2313" /LENGTH=138 /DNA_ID=CAMNT_0049070333 /DNA_START=48 /DNA_END=464 /DNA_ORIENTATION=-